MSARRWRPIASLRLASASLRLSAMTGITFLVLVGLVCAGAYLQFGVRIRESIDQSLTYFVNAQAASLAQTATDSSPQLLSGLQEDPNGQLLISDLEAQILDAEGTVLVGTEGLVNDTALLSGRRVVRSGAGVTVRGDTPINGVTYRYAGRQIPDRSGRIVVIGTPIGSLVEAERTLLAAVFGPSALLAILLAVLSGSLIARRGLRPLRQMTAQARAIGAHDLSQRLPVTGRHDEIGQLGTTLNGMLERLETAVGHERAFIADVSHELRTPMAIARAEIELAREAVQPTSLREGLTSAIEEIDRLSGIVDDLILLARADEEAAPTRAEAFELGEIVALTVTRFSTLALSRGVKLTSSGAAAVNGDPYGVERALANLLDNALRYTPDGGTITVTVEQRGSSVALVVRDSGTGVDSAMLSTLFDRRARSKSRPDGAGLGLAIVATVAASHGGSVSARNLREGGLEVSFTVG